MPFDQLKRRQFIALLSGAAACPRTAGAQNATRRIGVFVLPQDTSDNTPLFVETLAKLGWIEGRNVHIDYRTWNADPDSLRAAAAELIALHPDVIFAPALGLVAARAQTQTIPIVFVQFVDPVERGFVASLAKPGGNVTGFTSFEPSVGGKWLGLLKEIAPKLARSATLFNPDVAPHAPPYLHSVEAASRALGMATIAAPVRSDAEVEAFIAPLGRDGDGALLVIPDAFTIAHRQAIIRAAEGHRVPAIYSYRVFADDGGLMACGDDIAEEFRGAAGYVDRILKGAKPAELPVQEPTKYQLVINLKTAKALGLTVPNSMQLLADEVIE
jgi:putative tryptophan/tyrosine transport system substrate-binding protein